MPPNRTVTPRTLSRAFAPSVIRLHPRHDAVALMPGGLSDCEGELINWIAEKRQTVPAII
jgi:hypothetical protein